MGETGARTDDAGAVAQAAMLHAVMQPLWEAMGGLRAGLHGALRLEGEQDGDCCTFEGAPVPAAAIAGPPTGCAAVWGPRVLVYDEGAGTRARGEWHHAAVGCSLALRPCAGPGRRCAAGPPSTSVSARDVLAVRAGGGTFPRGTPAGSCLTVHARGRSVRLQAESEAEAAWLAEAIRHAAVETLGTWPGREEAEAPFPSTLAHELRALEAPHGKPARASAAALRPARSSSAEELSSGGGPQPSQLVRAASASAAAGVRREAGDGVALAVAERWRLVPQRVDGSTPEPRPEPGLEPGPVQLRVCLVPPAEEAAAAQAPAAPRRLAPLAIERKLSVLPTREAFAASALGAASPSSSADESPALEEGVSPSSSAAPSPSWTAPPRRFMYGEAGYGDREESDQSCTQHEGVLSKQTQGRVMGVRRWQRRYFVLRARTLSYFRDAPPSGPDEGDEPAAVIELDDVERVSHLPDKRGSELGTTLRVDLRDGGRTLMLRADSPDDASEWAFCVSSAAYARHRKLMLADTEGVGSLAARAFSAATASAAAAAAAEVPGDGASEDAVRLAVDGGAGCGAGALSPRGGGVAAAALQPPRVDRSRSVMGGGGGAAAAAAPTDREARRLKLIDAKAEMRELAERAAGPVVRAPATRGRRAPTPHERSDSPLGRAFFEFLRACRLADANPKLFSHTLASHVSENDCTLLRWILHALVDPFHAHARAYRDRWLLESRGGGSSAPGSPAELDWENVPSRGRAATYSGPGSSAAASAAALAAGSARGVPLALRLAAEAATSRGGRGRLLRRHAGWVGSRGCERGDGAAPLTHSGTLTLDYSAPAREPLERAAAARRRAEAKASQPCSVLPCSVGTCKKPRVRGARQAYCREHTAMYEGFRLAPEQAAASPAAAQGDTEEAASHAPAAAAAATAATAPRRVRFAAAEGGGGGGGGLRSSPSMQVMRSGGGGGGKTRGAGAAARGARHGAAAGSRARAAASVCVASESERCEGYLAYWLTLPPGVRYGDFLDTMHDWVRSDACRDAVAASLGASQPPQGKWDALACQLGVRALYLMMEKHPGARTRFGDHLCALSAPPPPSPVASSRSGVIHRGGRGPDSSDDESADGEEDAQARAARVRDMLGVGGGGATPAAASPEPSPSSASQRLARFKKSLTMKLLFTSSSGGGVGGGSAAEDADEDDAFGTSEEDEDGGGGDDAAGPSAVHAGSSDEQSCDKCQFVARELSALLTRSCGGARLSDVAVTTLLDVMTTPASHGGMELCAVRTPDEVRRSLMTRDVWRPALWRPLLAALRRSGHKTRSRALEDVNSLLIRRQENRDTLASQPSWQRWLLPLLEDAAPDAANQAELESYRYAMNVFSLAHNRAFLRRRGGDGFRRELWATLREVQARFDNGSRGLQHARTMLRSLVSTLAPARTSYEPELRSAAWGNVVHLARAVRQFVLHTPAFGAGPARPTRAGDRCGVGLHMTPAAGFDCGDDGDDGNASVPAECADGDLVEAAAAWLRSLPVPDATRGGPPGSPKLSERGRARASQIHEELRLLDSCAELTRALRGPLERRSLSRVAAPAARYVLAFERGSGGRATAALAAARSEAKRGAAKPPRPALVVSKKQKTAAPAAAAPAAAAPAAATPSRAPAPARAPRVFAGAAPPALAGGKPITVSVNFSRHGCFTQTSTKVPPGETAGELCTRLQRVLNLPATAYGLVHQGRTLAADRAVAGARGVRDGSLLMLDRARNCPSAASDSEEEEAADLVAQAW